MLLYGLGLTIWFTSELDSAPGGRTTGDGFFCRIRHVVSNRAGVRGGMLVGCAREHSGVCVCHHWYRAAVYNLYNLQ